MKYIVMCFVILMSGCWSGTRQEQTRHVEVERHDGIVAGQPTKLVIRKESSETTEEKTKSGVDPEAINAAVSSAVSAAMGNYQGSISKLTEAFSSKPAGSSTSDLIAAGTSAMTVLLGGAAMHRNASARRKEKELQELREKHIEVCKKLPPEEA